MTGRPKEFKQTKTPPKTPVTDTQRNGSITGVGIVLGFSLTFSGQWTFAPGAWRLAQALALCVAVVGIIFQIRALFGLLSLPPVLAADHAKSIRKFFIGVGFVLAAFFLHILLDFATDMLGWDILKWPATE
jgi:hypothetical protein